MTTAQSTTLEPTGGSASPTLPILLIGNITGGRRTMRAVGMVLGFAVVACSADPVPPAQAPTSNESERAAIAQWLEQSPTSPFRALVNHAIGAGITLGPADADIPLAGVALATVRESGASVTLTEAGATRPLGRGRTVAFGNFRLVAHGLPGRGALTVYGENLREYKAPDYYPVSDQWRIEVTLEPPTKAATTVMLALDGTEVDAREAGTVLLPLGDTTIRLRAMRMPSHTEDETEIEVFFRDSTNAGGTYPAGRFVSLVPLGGARYLLDFNRARNPYCAYTAVFPCPAPWRGNHVPAAVEAGERYHGGGLTVPPA